jgi:hypothetical protein
LARVYNGSKEGKNIDNCITYILNTVITTGANGFTDDEIYGMAVHYYDEESIDIGEAIKVEVAINHKVEYTEEEKQDIRDNARKKIEEEAYHEMKNKTRKKAPTSTKAEKKTSTPIQSSLF